MSVQPQEKLKIGAEVIASVRKTLVGSRKRMDELASTVSVKKGGDAHALLVKSRARITSAMKAFEAEAKAQGMRQKKGAIAIVALFATTYNHLDSAIDAIEEGELTREDLTQLAKETRAIIVQANTLMRVDVAAAGQEQLDDAAKFLRDAEQTTAMRWTPSEDPEDYDMAEKDAEKKDAAQRRHYDSIQHLFDGNRLHLTKLHDAKTSKEPFILIKMPVYPQTTSVVGEAQYEQAGIKAGGKAGFYVQLENQVLLGVNTAQLETVKYKDANGKPKKKIAKGALLKRTLEIVKIISQKRGTIYHVIGSDGQDISGAGRMAKASPGFVYYWLMDEPTLSRLNRVLGRNGHSFDVDDWGLAVPHR